MAVIVLNYPVTMVSLSQTAQTKHFGIQHRVERLIGLSQIHPTGINRDQDHNAFHVTTLCGKDIDAYPETFQSLTVCKACKVSKKDPEPTVLIRVMSAVCSRGREEAYWERYTQVPQPGTALWQP